MTNTIYLYLKKLGNQPNSKYVFKIFINKFKNKNCLINKTFNYFDTANDACELFYRSYVKVGFERTSSSINENNNTYREIIVLQNTEKFNCLK